MLPDTRKKHIVSYEKMSAEVAAAFSEKYPKGFDDYLPELTKYTKPDGTPFYAVALEFPEDVYLVKIQIKIDDQEDIERWLEREEDAETEEVAGTSPSSESESDETLPDDNIAQYGSEDDSSEA